MFVRALFIVGALAFVAPAALADTDNAAIVAYHDQVWNSFLNDTYRLQYGYDPYNSGFMTRNTWIDLRLRSGTTLQNAGSKLITAPKAAAITEGPNYRASGQVGGLGRQLSSGAPSVSLHGLSEGSPGATPSFDLHAKSNASFSGFSGLSQ